MPIIQRWIVQAVIAFILRQVAKFGAKTDWVKVKADVQARVADLIPGTFFDDEGKRLADAVLDLCVRVLKSTAQLEKILTLVAAEKFPEAIALLKDLLLKTPPETEAQSRFLVALAEKPQLINFAA